MEISREKAKAKIEDLVSQFKEQYTSYHANTYDEARLRIDFINKFFKALGWDVDNDDQLAEDYREVIYEDKLKIGKSTKAPDYGFRLSGSDKRLFFVEAKKPAVPVKTDKSAAYQLRRYGRSAETFVSILTNFEEFSIYDCSKTPSENDSAAVNRIKYIKYEDYATEFDFIYDTFSREAVVKGRFDRFVQSDTNKRGSVPLDKEFVELLNTWRKSLATSIAKNNLKLNEEQINFAVQQTIDRLIFLRFCEDRAVEHYGNLKNTTAKGNTYDNLLQVFTEADNKYNSGLFDFEKDTITKNLKVENKIIKDIVLQLYYPKCQYEFAAMPVEILGNAYEQFLGKVIRITPAHFAKIEEKPEVRKAGGVYYTPQYIVEYIVAHTVGELVKGKSPKEIEKIKIVDPACGSGSFLLGTFKYLLKHYTDWYLTNGYQEKKNGGGVLTPNGRLTTAEKRKILLTHIYGVDLDSNAVEVSKLSLLLKSMEGETQASINQQLTLHKERILPDLDKNIVCGNSLIGHDFFDGEFGFKGNELTELHHKIKPFDWKLSFPNAFKQGGFDAVIGNPPWGADLNNYEKRYLTELFPFVPTKTKDTYLYFLFHAIKISKKDSLVGLVLPNTWLLINNAEKVRKILLEMNLIEIIDFGDNVFRDAIVETSTLILENKKANTPCQVKRYKKGKLIIDQMINKNLWAKDSLTRFTIDTNESFDTLLTNILKGSLLFGDACEIIFGIKPYQLGYGKPPQTQDVIDKRIFHSNKKISDLWKPLLTGTDIKRYSIDSPDNLFIKYGDWLMYKSNESKMLGPKIFLRRTSDTIRACYDDKKYYGQNSLFIITSKTLNLRFLLGILNSKLIDFIYKRKCPQVGKIFAEIKPSIIKELPIKQIDTKPLEKHHDKIVQHVETMLDLYKELQTTQTPNAQQQLQSRITYADKKIDELVYELYGLTDEEIKIIEESV